MYKGKNGITLIMLVITIVIILILSGTVMMSFYGINNSTKQREFANEIYNLQKLVEQYEFLNDEYPVKDSINFNISSMSASLKEQFKNEPNYSSNVINLKEIDLSKAGVEEISRGTKKSQFDVYAISESTGIVYYLKGVTIGGQTYYTLTNELKEKLDFSKNSYEIVNYAFVENSV